MKPLRIYKIQPVGKAHTALKFKQVASGPVRSKTVGSVNRRAAGSRVNSGAVISILPDRTAKQFR
jgi:hypothetical protein